MNKLTVARIIASGLSTAGALVCPQLFANPAADIAAKAAGAAIASTLPDMAVFGWEKSKEVQIEKAQAAATAAIRAAEEAHLTDDNTAGKGTHGGRGGAQSATGTKEVVTADTKTTGAKNS